MSRFRNDTGDVRTVNDLGIRVGPFEEFDWPAHDVKVHGLPTGCTWLDAPESDAAATEAHAATDGSGNGETPPTDSTQPAKTQGKKATASKETGE
jgi:hypothetical protein